MVAFIKTFMDNMIYRLKEAPKGLDFARNTYPYGPQSDNIWYERTSPRHLAEMFSRFKDKTVPVLDLGCGKGYVLYALNKIGFSRVDGVEYTPAIAEIAANNMRALGLKDKVTIFNVDARRFDNYDPYGIIYMFHPFRKEVMKKVVHNLEESLKRAPRRFTVVYSNPVEHIFWDVSPYFILKEKDTLTFMNLEMDVYYYEHDPERKTKKQGLMFKDVLISNMERKTEM